jgi:dienelactone hydrolase
MLPGGADDRFSSSARPARGLADHKKRWSAPQTEQYWALARAGLQTRCTAAVLSWFFCVPLAAQQIHANDIVIPWNKAGSRGLSALLVYADLPGDRPLVVMTHGTSRIPEERKEVTAWSLLSQANWFARRGWTVLAVVRRGYGKSGGSPDYLNGRCPHTNYAEAGRESAEDLARAIEYGASLPHVDAAHVVAVGVSTGGFATVALTAKAPPGLVAAINFAGGRGSRADFDVCNPDDLLGAFHDFGKHSRTPMLWLYAENDVYFWPAIAHQFDAAFRAGGGQDQFVQVPATRAPGHGLFRRVADWPPAVDDFLKAQNLVWLPAPLPPPEAPGTPPPPGLSEAGEKAFRAYLLAGPHKAFAMSEQRYSFSAAQITVKMAQSKALDSCRHAAPKGEKCVVVSTDGAAPDQ